MARHTTQYLSNVGKSVAYASIKAFKDMNPIITETIETNADLMRSTYTTLKNIKKKTLMINRRKSTNTTGYIKGLATDLKKNLMEDIKTGNFYNKQREEEVDFFGDDDFGFEDIDAFEIKSSGPSKKSSISEIDMALDEAGAKITGAITNSSVRTAEYQVEATRESTNKMLAQQMAIFTQTHADMMVINGNVAGLVKFNNESMKTHIENSRLFYETQQKQMNEQTEILKQILELQKSIYVPKRKNSGNRKMAISEIFSSEGAVNIADYLKYIQQGRVSGGGNMLEMLQEFGIGKDIAANPLGSLLTAVIKMATPKEFKKSMRIFNESLSGAFATALVGLTKEKNGIGLMSTLGDILGVRGPKKTIDTGKYYKGAVAWDGKNSKALNEVIPTLLAKIYSAVSGGEEIRYDYNSGKFKTYSQVNREFQMRRNRYVASANEFIIPQLQKEIAKVKFANEQQRKNYIGALEKIMDYNFEHLDYFNPQQNFDARKYGIKAADARKYSELIKKMWSRIPKNKQMRNNRSLLEARDSFARYLSGEERAGDSILNMLFDGSISGTKPGSGDKAQAPVVEITSKLDETNAILQDILITLKSGGGSNNSGGSNGPIPPSPPNGPNPAGGPTQAKRRRRTVSSSDVATDKDIEEMMKENERKRATGEIRWAEYLRERARIKNIERGNRFGSKYGLYIDDSQTKMSIRDYINYTEEDREEDRRSYRDILRSMGQGQKASEKVKSFMKGINELAKQPIQFLGNVMGTVDKRLYHMLFGTGDGDEQSISQRIIKGFDNVFDKISSTVKDKLSDIKKAISNSDTAQKIFDKINSIFGFNVQEFTANIKQRLFDDENTSFSAGFAKMFKKGFSDIFAAFKRGLIGDENDQDSFYNKYIRGNLSEKGKEKRRRNRDWDDYANNIRDRSRNVRDDGRGETEPIGSAAAGMRRVKRTGVVAVSEGEMIVPQDLNPYNIRDRYRNERKAINRYNKRYGGDNDIYSYAEGGKATFIDQLNSAKRKIDILTRAIKKGTITFERFKSSIDKILDKVPEASDYAAKAVKSARDAAHETFDDNDYVNGAKSFGSKMGDEFKNLFDTIMGSDTTKKVQDAFDQKMGGDKSAKDVVGDLMSHIKDYLPSAAAGGLGGAILVPMLGISGGPLLGAAVGAGLGILSKSKTLQTYLFGEEITNEDGSKGHKGGLISKDITQKLDKYFPSMAKGSMLGAISGILPITPFGPVAGIMIGSAVGFASKNDELSSILFGDKDKLKDIQKTIGEKLPKMGVGAILGAGGGMILGSPFGLTTNLLVGATLGFVSDTEKFKDMMFGTKDVKGVRHGGIEGFVKDALKVPIKGLTDIFNWTKESINKRILTPLMDFAKPLTQSMRNLGDWLKDKLNNAVSEHITKPIGAKLNEKLIQPLTKMGTSVFKKIFQFNFLRKALPFMALGRVGRNWDARQLNAVGKGRGKTAAERQANRQELADRYKDATAKGRILNSKGAKADEFLQSQSLEGLESLQAIDFGLSGKSKKGLKKMTAALSMNGIGKHVDGRSISDILTAYVNKKNSVGTRYLETKEFDRILDAIENGNEDTAVKIIESKQIIPSDEKEILIKCIKYAIKRREKLLKDAENAKRDAKNLKDTYGIDIQSTFARRAIANEINARKSQMKADNNAENESPEMAAAQERTQTIVDTIRETGETIAQAVRNLAHPTSEDALKETRELEGNDAVQAAQEEAKQKTFDVKGNIPIEDNKKESNESDKESEDNQQSNSSQKEDTESPEITATEEHTNTIVDIVKEIGDNIVQAIRNLAHPNSEEALDETRELEGNDIVQTIQEETKQKIFNVTEAPKILEQQQAQQEKEKQKEAKKPKYVSTENGMMKVTTNQQGEEIVDKNDSGTRDTMEKEEEEDNTQKGIFSTLKGIGSSIKGFFGGDDENDGEEKHKASLKSVLSLIASPFKFLTGAVSGITGALGDIPVVGSLIKAIPSILPFIGVGLGISGLANTKVGTDEDGNDITIKDKVASVFDEIHQGYSDAKSMALGLPGSEEATITGFGEKLGESIFTIWEGKDGKGGLKSWLDTAWSKLKSTLTSLATTLGNTIGTAIVNAINPMSEEHGDYTVTDDNGKVYGIEKGEKFTLDNGEVVEATGIREIDESRGITTEVSAKKNTRNRFSNISFSASGGGGRGSGDIFFDKNGAYNIPMKINNLHYLFKLRSRKSYKTDEGLEIFEGYGYPIYDPAQSNFYRMITSEGDEEVDAKLGLGKSYKLYDNLYTILDAMKFEEYADPDKPASVWYSTKSKTYENFMKWKYGSYDAESAQETNTSADTSSESITIPAPNITGTTSSTGLEGLENNPYQNELVSRNGTTYTWDNENNKVALIAPENASAEMKPYYDFQIRLAQLQDELLHIGDDAEKRKEVFKKFLQLYQDRLNDTADENELYDYRDLIATQSNDYDKLFEMLEGMTADSDINSLDVSGFGSGLLKRSDKGYSANSFKYNNKSYKNLIPTIKYSGKASNIGVDYGSLFGMPGFNNPKAMSDKFDDAAEIPSNVFNQIQSIWTSASKSINSDVLNMPYVLSSGMRALNRFLAIAFGYASPEDKNIDFSKIVTDENYLDTRARYISENSPFYNLFAGVSGTNSNKKYTQQKAQAKATQQITDTTYTDSSDESNTGTDSTGTTTTENTSSAKKSLGSVILGGITKGVANLTKGVSKLLGAKVAAKGSGIKDNKPITNNGTTDYGDANPSEISFVSQKYSDFARRSFSVAGDTGRVTVSDAGCAPAVASMVINDLNTTSVPISMDEAIRTAKNYKIPNGGVTADYFVDQFKSHGLNTTFVAGQSSKKKDTIINRLRNGKPVILMGQDPTNRSKSVSPFGPYDHYVVATGISKDGHTIYINDPEARKANIPYNTDAIINKTKLGIIPISQGKKKAGIGLLNKVKQVLRNYTARSVGKMAYIGDSRTEGMQTAVGASDTVSFCAKVGVGYDHLKDTGSVFAKNKLRGNVVIIFNYGVNDLYNAEKYVKFYKENFAKNNNVYYMSINPVDESKLASAGYNINNTNNGAISRFNKTLKEFAGNRYIDTYSMLSEKGFNASDGLHYDKATYIKIHQFVCEAIGASSSTASTSSDTDSESSTDYTSSGTTLGGDPLQNIKNIGENVTGIADILSIFDQLASAWGFADASGAVGSDISDETTTAGDSALGGSYTISGATASAEYNGEKFSGPVSTAPGAAKKQIDLVKQMLSVKEKLHYGWGPGSKYPSPTRDPDQVDSNGDRWGDCSSTVQWAYKHVTGKDVGDWTGAQLTDSDTYIIQEMG